MDARKILLMCAIALVAVAVLALGARPVDALNDPPLPNGGPVNLDWTCSDIRTYYNGTITMNANLIIAPTGNLTLDNMTLVMNGAADGQRSITVQGRGAFRLINGTRVTAQNTNFEYSFSVQPGGTLVLERAEISEAGWDPNNFGPAMGLYIQSDSVSINNSRIHDCAVGLVTNGATFGVTNTTISFCVGNNGAPGGGGTGGIAQQALGAIVFQGQPWFVNVTVSNITGGTGGTGNNGGGLGGGATGILCVNSNTLFRDCTVASITGGNGGNALWGTPGNAGTATGMLIAQCYPTLANCTIREVTGGTAGTGWFAGGICGDATGIAGSQAGINITDCNITRITAPNNPLSASVRNGPVAYGMSLFQDNSTVKNTTITLCRGGNGNGINANGGDGNGLVLSLSNGTVVKGCRISGNRGGASGGGTGAAGSGRGAFVASFVAVSIQPNLDGNVYDNMNDGVLVVNCNAQIGNSTFSNLTGVGAMFFGSNGTADSNTVTGAAIGFGAQNSAPTVSSNSITGCAIGIAFSNCTGRYDGNTLTGLTIDGINIARSSGPLVSNNNITGCRAAGINITNSYVLVENNVLTDNIQFGLYCNVASNVSWNVTSNCVVRNNEVRMKGNLTVQNGGTMTIQACACKVMPDTPGGYGMELLSGGRMSIIAGASISRGSSLNNYLFSSRSGSTLEIRNSTVSGCGVSGAAATAGPCIETSNAELDNATFNDSREGVVFRLSGTAARMQNCQVTNNWHGVHIAEGAGPAIVGCTFINNSVGLLVEDAGGAISGCTIRTSWRNGGILVRGPTASPAISDILLDGNYIAVNTTGAASVTYIRLTITSSNLTAASAIGGSGTFVNCSISGSIVWDVLLDQTGNITFVNTTFASSKVKFLDDGSVLRVFWHLHIRTVWQNNATVDSPALTVKTASLAAIWTGNGDINGSISWLTVEQYRQTNTSRTDYGPHTVSATKLGLSGNATITLDATKTVAVTIVDDVLPLVSIGAPAESSLQNSSTLLVRGNASDNIGLLKVEVSFDGITWYGASGLGVWNYTFVLPDGNYRVYARATDLSSNLRMVNVSNITIDTAPPAVRITVPVSGTQTALKNLVVLGNTEPNTLVLVNGVQTTSNSQGLFCATVVLGADGQYRITARAQDAAGNFAEHFITVTLDTTPPEIAITAPTNNTRTNKQVVIVNGTVELGATVQLNGRAAVLLSGTEWTLGNVQLSEGVNTITARATDGLGNFREVSFTIILDTRIVLNVTSPAEFYKTNKALVRFNGTTDPGAAVKLGNLSLTADAQGYFEGEMTLSEGSNTLAFTASDDVGNVAMVNLTVVVDTVAPPVEITYPLAGAKIKNATVTLSGRTEAGASVTIGNRTFKAGSDGLYSLDIPLVKGTNTVVVSVSDSFGNTNSATVTFTRTTDGGTGGPGVKVDNGNWWWILVVVVGALCAVGAIAFVLKRKKDPPEQLSQQAQEQYRPGKPDMPAMPPEKSGEIPPPPSAAPVPTMASRPPVSGETRPEVPSFGPDAPRETPRPEEAKPPKMAEAPKEETPKEPPGFEEQKPIPPAEIAEPAPRPKGDTKSALDDIMDQLSVKK